MNTEKTEIELLITELRNAAQAYYQESTPLMSDEDYDNKLSYLKELVKDTEYAKDDRVVLLLEGDVAGGSHVSSNDTVRHEQPMLSLGKANSREDIDNYVDMVVKKGAKGFTYQAKLDGYAISAVYVDGMLIQISTRGDGVVGQDMTYLKDNDNISIQGLPSMLNNKETVELRGELFFTNKQFENANNSKYNAYINDFNSKNKDNDKTPKDKELIDFKNSRNAVVGISKKALQGLDYNVELTFSTYTIIKDNTYADFNKSLKGNKDLVFIDDLSTEEYNSLGGKGLLVSDNDKDNVWERIQAFGKIRPLFDIPTDGIVIKPSNESEMYNNLGHTAHHPIAFIAFKYPGERKHTIIKNIEWNVGRTGRLAPVGIIDPVDIGGTTIGRVTLNNLNWMHDKGIRVGSVVEVTRANDVIPAVTTVLSNPEGSVEPVITNCPICNSILEGDGNEYPKLLRCVNKNCPSRQFSAIVNAVSRRGFDIEGLSESTVSALIDAGLITNMVDIFSLTADDMANVYTGTNDNGTELFIGQKRALKIVDEVDRARKETESYKILALLGYEGLGVTVSKLLIKELGSIEKVINASKSVLESISGIGSVLSEEMAKHSINARETLNKLKESGVNIDYSVNKNIQVSNGKHFSITGNVPTGYKNRQEFVDFMESNGWTFDKSPKKTTDVVIGDKASTSSKTKKAIEYGLTIVSPDDFKI